MIRYTELIMCSPQPVDIVPHSLAHVVAVMTIYSIVIAVFKVARSTRSKLHFLKVCSKDLPDTSGDAMHGITTVGIRLGVRLVILFSCAI